MMPCSDSQKPWSTIEKCVGRSIYKIKLRVYIFKGTIDLEDTPLEIVFADGTQISLDGGSDGESLRVSEEPWIDSFKDSLSTETEDFIAKHGLWEVQDYSTVFPFSTLPGQSLLRVSQIHNEFGILSGVNFHFADSTLTFKIVFDECKLTLHQS